MSHPTHFKGRPATRKYLKDGIYKCPCCKFCTEHDYKLYYHIDEHLKHAVHLAEYDICKCSLQCRSTAHFHCLYCTKTIIRKDHVPSHLNICPSNKMLLSSSASTLHLASSIAATRAPQSPGKSSEQASTVAATSAPQSPAAPSKQASTVAATSAPLSPGNSSELASTVAAISAPLSPAAPSELASTVVATSTTPSPVSASRVPSSAPPHKRITNESVMCPYCGVTIYRRNVKLHIQRKHKPREVDIAANSVLEPGDLEMAEWPETALEPDEDSFDSSEKTLLSQKKNSGTPQLESGTRTPILDLSKPRVAPAKKRKRRESDVEKLISTMQQMQRTWMEQIQQSHEREERLVNSILQSNAIMVSTIMEGIRSLRSSMSPNVSQITEDDSSTSQNSPALRSSASQTDPIEKILVGTPQHNVTSTGL
ncbi:uncharacterized protein ACNS7B_019185 isoform 2-T2 [Menidia menidia]